MKQIIPFLIFIGFALFTYYYQGKKEWLLIIERILAIFVILFYSLKNIYYGIIVCFILIFYFNWTDFKEGFDQRLDPLGPSTEDLIQTTNNLSLEDNIQNKIPKIIIQTWKTAEIPEKYKKMVNSLRSLNPDFEYKFFSDEDIEFFIKSNYPDYYMTYDRLPIKIQKIDFFRYIAIYHYGGFYFDLDMNGLEPLDNLVLNNDCVFPVDEIIKQDMCRQERYAYFCNNNMYFLLGQYAFGAKVQNLFIKSLIDHIHINIDKIISLYNISRNKEIYVYTTTGPDFVSKVYLDFINKNSIKILHNNTRQQFGKYAQHKYFGTWKVKTLQ
jgi:hypothetical protein